MKRQLSADEEEHQQEEEEEEDSCSFTTEKECAKLLRINDTTMQRQWVISVETHLYDFIKNSPLKHISANITQDHYVNMANFLVSEVLRMSNPEDGVKMAITGILDAMHDVCREATYKILGENREHKSPTSITLLCETIPMPGSVQINVNEGDEDAEPKMEIPKQAQDVIDNDKERKWLQHYKQAKCETVNVFTVKLGPGLEKATPKTGRYVVSLLMPREVPLFRLVPEYEHRTTNESDLEERHHKTLTLLNASQRLIKFAKEQQGSSLYKLTILEEAERMAGQLQNKQLQALKNDYTHALVLIDQLNAHIDDIKATMLEDKNLEKETLKDCIALFLRKIRRSRAENVQLALCLKRYGIDPAVENFVQCKETPNKRIKLEESPLLIPNGSTFSKESYDSSGEDNDEEKDEEEGDEDYTQ